MSSLCIAAPFPQKKSEKGPLHLFFLRGGGGCTQVKSVCKAALEFLFWVPSCVPGFEYET